MVRYTMRHVYKNLDVEELDNFLFNYFCDSDDYDNRTSFAQKLCI